MLVLRSQLGQQNRFYPATPPVEDPTWRTDITPEKYGYGMAFLFSLFVDVVRDLGYNYSNFEVWSLVLIGFSCFQIGTNLYKKLKLGTVRVQYDSIKKNWKEYFKKYLIVGLILVEMRQFIMFLYFSEFFW